MFPLTIESVTNFSRWYEIKHLNYIKPNFQAISTLYDESLLGGIRKLNIDPTENIMRGIRSMEPSISSISTLYDESLLGGIRKLNAVSTES
ncbi:hypothetical protein, partial [Gracilibacillus alcaliphilus]